MSPRRPDPVSGPIGVLLACLLLVSCAQSPPGPAGTPAPTVPAAISSAPAGPAAPPATPPAPAPVLTPRPGASLVDVPYGDGAGRAQLLDLHFPTGPGPWPVVLFVHGGSWLIGDKEMPAGTGYGALRESLLARGYAVVSANYRPSSRARFPAQLHDVQGAIRFVREHAAVLGLDAGRLALAGESAGAHLALLAALAPDDPAPVRAVVSLYGVTDLTRLGADLAATGCGVPAGGDAIVAALLGAEPAGAGRAAALAASPVTHAGARRIPILLVHGTRDCVVPAEQSRRMAAALRAADAPVRLELLDAEHSDPRLYGPGVLAETVAPFLADALG